MRLERADNGEEHLHQAHAPTGAGLGQSDPMMVGGKVEAPADTLMALGMLNRGRAPGGARDPTERNVPLRRRRSLVCGSERFGKQRIMPAHVFDPSLARRYHANGRPPLASTT
jgi:hypothetical protein